MVKDKTLTTMYKLSYSLLHKFGGSKTKRVMVLVAIAFQVN